MIGLSKSLHSPQSRGVQIGEVDTQQETFARTERCPQSLGVHFGEVPTCGGFTVL